MSTLPQILTLTEVADHLGVDTSAVASWARDGFLPVCGRSEAGELLFYRWRVERDGGKLASGEPVRIVKRRDGRHVLLHDGRKLRCGCIVSGNPEPDQIDPHLASWLCPTARLLQTVQQLTGLMAAAAPDNPLGGQLASVAQAGLADHLATGLEESRAREGRRAKQVEQEPTSRTSAREVKHPMRSTASP